MSVSAIVPAAGLGIRFKNQSHPTGVPSGGIRPTPKPLLKLGSKPLFIHSLNILNRHPKIKEIILVVSPIALEPIARYLKRHPLNKVRDLVLGGATRRDSVERGLLMTSQESDLILVHDAVRPFIDMGIVSRVISAAEKFGAAVVGVPVKATIKKVKGQRSTLRFHSGLMVSEVEPSKVKGTFIVEETVERNNLWEIQTPQVFRRDLLFKAYQEFPNVASTDEASLVERLGFKVRVILGSYFNIKITTHEDLVFARAILQGHPFCQSGDTL